ncbi:MAG: hypothetical protein QW669_03765 [Desulfurococcaceae archaeon]
MSEKRVAVVYTTNSTLLTEFINNICEYYGLECYDNIDQEVEKVLKENRIFETDQFGVPTTVNFHKLGNRYAMRKIRDLLEKLDKRIMIIVEENEEFFSVITTDQEGFRFLIDFLKPQIWTY